MGDKNRPRSKTGRSPSSNSIKSAHRSGSKAESVVEPDEDHKVENTIPWDIFSHEQIQELMICSDPEDLLDKVSGMLDLHSTRHVDLKSSNVSDMYLLAIYYGKERGFTELQVGGLVTLLAHLLQQIQQDDMNLIQLVSLSSQLLTCKTVFREPDLMFDFFTETQVLQISEYLESTVFQHYNLYKYCLLQQQTETIISIDKIVSTCPPLGCWDPAPLAEAISEADIELYCTAPVQSPSLSVQEEASDEVVKEPDQTQVCVNEGAPESNLISLANVQTVLDTVGNDMLDKFSKTIQSKCQDKESQYMNRLNKVKKAID